MTFDMIFDGPPPAFIIMNYILGLTVITLTLLGAIDWLHTDVPLFHRPYRVTLTWFGFFSLGAVLLVGLLALVNVMIGADQHVLDEVILTALLPLHAFFTVFMVWAARRIAKRKRS
ncbi:MAG: hypothetical protein V3U31_04025 [Dehalococcoidia bacterium]